MRSLAGLATVLISATAATAAGAQTLAATHSQTAADEAAILNRAAFAPGAYGGSEGFTTNEVRLSRSADGPVDSLRISTGGFHVLSRNPALDAEAYEVALTRDWPGAVSFDGKTFGFDVSPHAGVGMGALGGSAEAGATLQVSKRESLSETAAQRLKALGLRDGARFGDRGRWYLFAAASGRAVGLNMLRSDNGTGWDRAWSQDATSTIVGDAQVGLGWRKGPVQTSFGYMHRETKGVRSLFGVDPKADDMVAFSLSIKPHR